MASRPRSSPAPRSASSRTPAPAPARAPAAPTAVPTRASLELSEVVIRGAREHNLKGVDVDIPKRQLVVLTGVSGSGKSSLAFDTLFAEGQRRYVESLSAYARQFLGRLEKPKADSIHGLSPTIAIEQKSAGSNPRSTVGTITEISDYLRVLWARVGTPHCPDCGVEVVPQTAERIARELGKRAKGTRLTLLAPLLTNRKGEHRELLEEARRQGWVRLRVDGEIVPSEGLEALEKRQKHDVEAVIDRVVIGQVDAERLQESVARALSVGKGTLIAQDGEGDSVISQSAGCPKCGRSLPELSPQSFSFNAPQGMCPGCHGLGTAVAIDPSRVVPDPTLSLDQGAVQPWGPDVSTKTGWVHDFRGQLVEALGIDPKVPWRKLTEAQRRAMLHGTGEKRYPVEWKSKSGAGSFQMKWEGLLPQLMRRMTATKSERARAAYAKYMGDAVCSECHGERLRRESAAVRLGGATLVQLSAGTVEQALAFFGGLTLAESARLIAADLLREIEGRLRFLTAVGLGYLSLDRPGPTLSGGESQRIRLASQVGSDLSGVIYVLDEPSIGLHQRDNERLLETLIRLRDLGNTVVVVEHDEDTIRAADHVVDFGPGAGVRGGEVVYAGTPAGLVDAPRSLTGAYLSGRQRIATPATRRPGHGKLTLQGVTANNLKDLDVEIPLGTLVAVTGVSGAGKSSLVNDVLVPALAAHLHGAEARPGPHRALLGLEQLDKVVEVDQQPIGRTPRSNPATYVKAFDAIRGVFAALPDARARGFGPARFSFNLKGGRCEACEGDGVRTIEMHFLADVYVRCEECGGRRFNPPTLAVQYKGKSIADVLELTVAEALALFSAHADVAAPLALLAEVGVDYLHLGQPSPTLSGGEAQRIKLARELARRATGRTLYVLDEPTTGLHFDDVAKLLGVFERLVASGNTVLVVEHHLDVIRSADWVIDLGPEGGPGGGHLVATGTPEQVARVKASHTGRYLRAALGEQRSRQGAFP